MLNKERNGGFTLVELAIVLVIIGLIIGSVLVGQDLVMTAQARSVMSQFTRYDVAIATFRGKYSCLPGDCYNANMFGLGVNGNGNGGIDTVKDSSNNWLTFVDNGNNGLGYISASSAEGNAFWVHLSNAQVIADTLVACVANDCIPGANFPMLTNGIGGVTIFEWAGKTGYITGRIEATNLSATKIPALKGQHVDYMMKKVDVLKVTYIANESHAMPLALAQGDRVVPISGDSGDSNLLADSVSNSYASQLPQCAIGARISLTGNCNVIWRIQGM